MQRRRVVFPDPLGPMIVSFSPTATSRLMPLRTSRSPNRLCKSTTRTNTRPFGGAKGSGRDAFNVADGSFIRGGTSGIPPGSTRATDAARRRLRRRRLAAANAHGTLSVEDGGEILRSVRSRAKYISVGIAVHADPRILCRRNEIVGVSHAVLLQVLRVRLRAPQPLDAGVDRVEQVVVVHVHAHHGVLLARELR